MKVIIPLAGKDPRFEKLDVYKPLIDIAGKPLIYRILSADNINFETLHFVILQEHEKKHEVSKQLENIFGSNVKTYIIDKETEGSPNTILEIADVINDDEDILIELGDVLRDTTTFVKDISVNKTAHGILPIDDQFTTEMWGYITAENGHVNHLYEKSTHKMKGGATMGLYYFSKGKEFVRYAKQMIEKEIKILPYNLYYVGVVYNEYIDDNKLITSSQAKILDVLGGPEQIDAYIKKVSYNK